jgi:hypothetical protein
MRLLPAALVAAALALAAPAAAAPLVRSGADAPGSKVNVTAAIDAFRADLGADRQEITWDDAPSGEAAPNNYMGFYASRGIGFTNNASGTFELSHASTDPGTIPARFGDIDASYTALFSTFSGERLFAGAGDNVTVTTFHIYPSFDPAVSRGFGAVFTDVDLAQTTKVEFFDKDLNLVLTEYVPPSPTAGNGGLSFVGVSFPDGPPIGEVDVTAGNRALHAGDQEDATHDVVAMDDLIYATPYPAGADADGVPDPPDNCPADYNPNQRDSDGDGQGDVCDSDDDGDSAPDGADNCPLAANPTQVDTDGDGQGDSCDADDDGDGVADASDDCPLVANASQSDADADGLGDVCDPTPLPPGPPGDVSAPLVTKLKLKRRGTRLSLVLSEPATLKIAVKRGKKVRKRYTRTGTSGLNRFKLKRMKPGRYRLTLTASDSAGNKSNALRRSFRVKKKRKG